MKEGQTASTEACVTQNDGSARDTRPREGSLLKRGLRRMSVSLGVAPSVATDPSEIYAVENESKDATSASSFVTGADAAAGVGNSANRRRRRTSIAAMFGFGDSTEQEEEQEIARNMKALEEEQAAAAEAEARRRRLMEEQLRLEKERKDKLAAALRATEEAERMNAQLIQARREKLQREEEDAKVAEGVRRVREMKEREVCNGWGGITLGTETVSRSSNRN